MTKFGKAFAAARKAGKKEFTFGGERYHTRTREEDTPKKAAAPAAKATAPAAKAAAPSGKTFEDIVKGRGLGSPPRSFEDIVKGRGGNPAPAGMKKGGSAMADAGSRSRMPSAGDAVKSGNRMSALENREAIMLEREAMAKKRTAMRPSTGDAVKSGNRMSAMEAAEARFMDKNMAMGGAAYAKGGSKDMAQDKATASRAVHKHERAMHKGAPMTKLAKGGSSASRADGCAQRGKTRGRVI